MSAESSFDAHDAAERKAELENAVYTVTNSEVRVNMMRESFDTLGDSYHRMICEELLERIKKMKVD